MVIRIKPADGFVVVQILCCGGETHPVAIKKSNQDLEWLDLGLCHSRAFDKGSKGSGHDVTPLFLHQSLALGIFFPC
ncbi:hypothetical protein PAXRUDRAFT_836459 [Paxillus rubicundulus Ve08.2h10]|uniref:Uncharacterized protein n=1 Tax=Paxillus rubicundulus Ve08.2h10 TaxID=930991 RepID=A0A0D0BLG4_9AGAM|nr:hypothetical protein PAXRUDRAFT_836459 [Paxillus rubicundulus Ve08.2h10]